MFPRFSPPCFVLLMLSAAFVLAGCNAPPATSTGDAHASTSVPTREPAPRPPSENTIPPAPVVAEVTESDAEPATTPLLPTPPPLDAAAVPVVARLAQLLQVSAEEISVTQVARADWPNSCLGLAAEGEICAQVITPGFAVSLIANEQRFDYRTDESGRRIRLAFAPLVEIGEALLTWSDANSFAVLQIGTERSKIGQRGRPLLAVPLPSPRRSQELVAFLSRFAPFKAHTPAGEVVLRGVGAETASAAQCRQIAEWAGVVAAELEQRTSSPMIDRAMVWRREGGTADSCDELVVSRLGFATAWNCRETPARAVATLSLNGAELQQLYQWLDSLGPCDWSSDGDGATDDLLAISLTLEGQGTKTLSDLEREAMLAFAHHLVRRILTDGTPAAP